MTTEEKLSSIQEKWVETIHQMNDEMKTLPKLNELLNKIYATRQDCVEYQSSILSIYANLQRTYNKSKAAMYTKLKVGEGGIRYTNDSAIYNQIDAALVDQKKMIDTMSNHIEYIRETLKTIDNMIFGVKQKIEVYKLINGLS